MRKKFEKHSSIHSSESKTRKTVGVKIRPELLLKAREMKVNLSKILEKSAETMIEHQNNPLSLSEGSLFAKRESSMVGRTGFEPATFCTSSRCPNRTRRPALQPFQDVFLVFKFQFSSDSKNVRVNLPKHWILSPITLNSVLVRLKVSWASGSAWKIATLASLRPGVQIPPRPPRSFGQLVKLLEFMAI